MQNEKRLAKERDGVYRIKMSNGETGKIYGDEVISFAKRVAKIKHIAFSVSGIPGALDFLSNLDSRNSYTKIA